MASSDAQKNITVTAGSAVTEGRFVVLASDGKYDHVSGAQGRASGAAAETVAAEDDVFAMAKADGAIVKVEAGAAVEARNDFNATAYKLAQGYGYSEIAETLETATLQAAAAQDNDLI